jgi:XcyI restriction endonuclease
MLIGPSLLSIGPQLSGGSSNERGDAGIEYVYQLISKAISHAKPVVSGRIATLDNVAGRQVVIEVAADPDTVFIEKSSGHVRRPLVDIEVKAVTDASNIHNRIGEAEKSHLKAKARKFMEYETIVNMAKLDPVVVAQQSPTTYRFFTPSELMETASQARADFISSIVALTGIKTKSKNSTKT